jgi:tryptophan-rich sensory protein
MPIDTAMAGSRRSLKRDGAFAALAVAVVASVSLLGQIATYPNLAPWYAGLIKPAFNPPNWLFAPVWTALYALMAFALWRILRLPASMPGRTAALSLFFLQLALNAAWSWMFFWAHSPLLGLVNIVPQLAFVLATLVALVGVDKWAAWCLAPLAAWVAYASILNFSIWWLNG